MNYKLYIIKLIILCVVVLLHVVLLPCFMRRTWKQKEPDCIKLIILTIYLIITLNNLITLIISH